MQAVTRIATAAVLLAAGAAETSAQTVYRCTDSTGRAVYQQHACTAAGAKVHVTPGNVVSGDRTATLQAQRDITVRSAIGRGLVIEGMTEAEVQQAIGLPVSINTTRSNGSVKRQLVYRYDNGDTRYVYTENGVVHAVQDRQSGRAPRVASVCPTAQDIHNHKVSMSSITLSEERRAQLADELRQMQACRP